MHCEEGKCGGALLGRRHELGGGPRAAAARWRRARAAAPRAGCRAAEEARAGARARAREATPRAGRGRRASGAGIGGVSSVKLGSREGSGGRETTSFFIFSNVKI